MIFNFGRVMKQKLFFLGLVLSCSCGSGSGNGNNEPTAEVPDIYDFQSRFDPAQSSVSYSGQTFRHVLISDLKLYIGGLSDDIDSGTFQPTIDGEVVQALETYLKFDSTISGQNPLLTTTDPVSTQTTYDDISSGKNLIEKLAGKDDVTDHKDWSQRFTGWNDTELAQFGGAVNSPEGFVRAMFETIEAQTLDRANGTIATGPNDEPLPVYVTPSGLDLQQLTAKFLLMSIAFSQGTDDYLDDDVDGKGLLSPNTRDEDAMYTALEHAWDEGFGYFGAARDYGVYTDKQIAESAHIDSDKDAAIDLTAECNFGAAINAAKRDIGAEDPVDFSGEAFDAFVLGRTIIANAGESLTDRERKDLAGHRDTAVLAWEKAVAATVVHYINDTIEEMDRIGTPEYDFLLHAKVWSEMKGFAIGFQFNPRSPMSSSFDDLHELLRDAPTLTNDESYVADLLDARKLVQDAYGFSDANVAAW